MDSVASTVDGSTVAFEVAGEGAPTVVFIHGLVGDHSDFSYAIEAFAQTNQVVAVDLPGAGGSRHDRSVWTMAALGADVATVVDHLGLDDVVLVGHSLGGNVTVEAAEQLRDRVRALVWVSSFRSLDSALSEWQVQEWFAPFDEDFVAAMDDLNRRNFGPHADLDLVDAVTSRARAADRSRVLALLRSKFAHQPTVVEAINNLDIPIYAINSDFKHNDETSFKAHGVDLRVLPGVGHFVMMEDPDAFNAELADVMAALS